MDEVAESVLPSVSEFFKGKTVLITGGGGYVGSILLEKLLRTCPEIKTVFILIKANGESPCSRLTKVLSTCIFDEVRRVRGSRLPEVVPIKGDLSKKNLGLTFSDFKLIRSEVNVVFNCAGLVQFNIDAKSSLESNFTGAKNMLQFCKEMKKLKALVHISTAYAFCNLDVVDETICPPSGDLTDDILELLVNERFSEVESLGIIKTRPATYHYGKAAAEVYIQKNRGDLPVAIVRPSTIVAAFSEPLPGWVDDRNGPAGLISCCMQGLIRSVYADKDAPCDFIPVDYVVNTLISAAYYIATSRLSDMLIVNCVCSDLNPLKWGDVERLCYPLFLKYPTLEHLIRYPWGSFKRNYWHHYMASFCLHWGPAYMLDMMRPLGLGRHDRMVDKCAGAHRVMRSLEYFTTTRIIFRSPNMRMLMNYLNPDDRKIFYIDVCNLSWDEYMEVMILGVRRYVLKEPDSNLISARRNLERKRKLTKKAARTLLATPAVAFGIIVFWFAVSKGWA